MPLALAEQGLIALSTTVRLKRAHTGPGHRMNTVAHHEPMQRATRRLRHAGTMTLP